MDIVVRGAERVDLIRPCMPREDEEIHNFKQVSVDDDDAAACAATFYTGRTAAV